MDLQQYDLEKPPDPPSEPPRRYPWIWVAAGIVVVILVAAYLMTMRRGGPEPDRVAVSEVTPEQPAPRDPLGGEGDDIDLPPLEDTDPLVRELVRRLSTHPTVVSWLTTDNLLRRFTAGVQNIAAGRSPAPHVQRLAPSAPFAVSQRDGETVMDARSYGRYDTFAAAVDSIDPDGAARLYSTLKPRLEEAYGELGTGSTFDAALERAIFVLLQTPVVDRPVRLEVKGVNYVYADPRLEELTPAQKHLLRMGPRNMRVIQAKLRAIARALGIPDERLPGR